MRQTVMLTGDNEQVAKAVAASVGITDVRSGLLQTGAEIQGTSLDLAFSATDDVATSCSAAAGNFHASFSQC